MSELIIRHSAKEDLDAIMEIVAMGSAWLKSQGVRQWINGYPSRERICQDMEMNESFVCEENGKVIGTAVLSLRNEPTYDVIYDGAWLTDGTYGVIHRIGIHNDCKGRGVAAKFVAAIEKMCINAGINAVRVDTHEMNKSMRRMVEKNGFTYCGVIILENGDPRVAYEKVLE